MKKTFVTADSPVNVGAFLPVASGSQPIEEVFLGVADGNNVTFDLPEIASLPGAQNQKIAIVMLGSGKAKIQPFADDTVCTLGTGIAAQLTGAGNSVILQPVFDIVWHSDENSTTAFKP